MARCAGVTTPRLLRASSWSALSGFTWNNGRDGRRRDHYSEDSSQSRGGFDRAAARLHMLPIDRQVEAGALGACDAWPSKEAIEDALALFRRQTLTVVAHGHGRPRRRTALWGVPSEASRVTVRASLRACSPQTRTGLFRRPSQRRDESVGR